MNVEVKLVDGIPRTIHKVVVHKFSVGDVEDPDLYAAEPIYNWEQSEAGQFVMSKSLETPIWIRQKDYQCFSLQYAIVAKLYEADLTYFLLKFK